MVVANVCRDKKEAILQLLEKRVCAGVVSDSTDFNEIVDLKYPVYLKKYHFCEGDDVQSIVPIIVMPQQSLECEC